MPVKSAFRRRGFTCRRVRTISFWRNLPMFSRESRSVTVSMMASKWVRSRTNAAYPRSYLRRRCPQARCQGRAGRRPHREQGFFFPPTVITDLQDDAMLMTEEPFGPLLVVPFDTLDEVLARAIVCRLACPRMYLPIRCRPRPRFPTESSRAW